MDKRNEPAQRVWAFAETDYRFGAGTLRMIVHRVDWSAPLTHDGETWYEVHGTEVSEDGRVIGPRRTTVRASRLPAAWRRG